MKHALNLPIGVQVEAGNA